MLLLLVRLPREFRQQLLRSLVGNQDDAAFAQTLQRSMQAARRRAKIDDDIDEAFAGVVCSFDELLLVQIFAPLDDVDTEIEGN